jgi:hypothetical protein
VFRFFLPWPPVPDDRKDRDKDLVDLALDGDFEIDTGVTSGADPSEWDPINVDERRPQESCTGEGSQASSGPGSPPACGVRQQ